MTAVAVRLPILVACALVAAGAGPSAVAQAPRITVTTVLETDTAWRLRSPHRIQKSQNRLALDVDARLAHSLRLRAIGWTLWDPVGRLVGPEPDFDAEPIDRVQVDDSRHVELELRELYLDWRARVAAVRLDLRIGKQQIVWGQSLGLRILDVVNPQDLREFILDQFIEARTPLFGIRLEALVGGVSFEAFAFPDFEPTVLADPASEFALDPELPGFLPRFATFSAPPAVTEPFALVEFRDEETPDDWELETTAFGFRVARFWKGFDLSLHYFDSFDAFPAFRRRIETRALPGFGAVAVNVLEPDHVRVRRLGGAFSTARGSFTVWGEGALAFDRAFVVDDLSDRDGIRRRAELQYVVAVDWLGPHELFANVQWIQAVVLSRDSSLEIDRVRSFASLLLRLELRRATVVPQLFVLAGLDEPDAMVRPSLEWRLTDRLSVTIGVDAFFGDRDGLFGQFAHERRCVPVPAALPVPSAGRCVPDAAPGRASRAFLRVRYTFSWSP